MGCTARRKNGFSVREIQLTGSGRRSTAIRVAGELAGELGAIFNFDDECADFFRSVGFKWRQDADIQHGFGAVGRGFRDDSKWEKERYCGCQAQEEESKRWRTQNEDWAPSECRGKSEHLVGSFWNARRIEAHGVGTNTALVLAMLQSVELLPSEEVTATGVCRTCVAGHRINGPRGNSNPVKLVERIRERAVYCLAPEKLARRRERSLNSNSEILFANNARRGKKINLIHYGRLL